MGPRILVTDAGKHPLLKARMTTPPQHRQALATVLEGLALWEGSPIRAALVVGEPGRCDTSHYHDLFADPCHSPLYTIDYVPTLAAMRRQQRDRVEGMGKFHDLRELLTRTVAR
jgi:hypothetical protein